MEEDKELEEIRRRKLRELSSKVFGKETERKERTVRTAAPNKPVEVTDTSFEKVVQNYPLVVVDCWALWCPPCRMIAPIVEELARDYVGKIVFGKLNVDENQMVAVKYQIMSIPTMLVFKNGKLVDRIIGAMPRRMLEAKITRYL